MHNHTVVDPRVKVEVEVWLPPGGDATRALELLAADEGVDARVSAVDHEGITLVRRRAGRRTPASGEEWRRACVKKACERLRDAGLSSVPTG